VSGYKNNNISEVENDNINKKKVVEQEVQTEKKATEMSVEERKNILKEKRVGIEKGKREIQNYGHLNQFLKHNPSIAQKFTDWLDLIKTDINSLEKETDLDKIDSKIKKINSSISKIQALIRNRDNLKQIYISLPKKEREEFKYVLKEVDAPAYRTLVLLEGDKTDGNIDATGKILLGSGDLKGAEIKGNEIVQTHDDGTVVTVGENGERSLKLADSDYKMEAEIDNADDLDAVNKIQKGVNEEVKPLNSAIGSLDGLIKSIDAWSKNGNSFETIKNILKKGWEIFEKIFKNIPLQNQAEFENIVANASSVGDLIAKLHTFKEPFEKSKKEKEEEAKKKIDTIIEANAKEAKDKNDKQKEILQFLNNIGFDLLPKDATDYVIARIKEWSLIVPWLNLDRWNIDIANGHFGESLLDKWWVAWKQNLVNFMNVVLYGEINPKNSIDSKVSVWIF